MSEQTNSSMIGRENVYTCEVCGKYTVTVDVDEGVTPFMILCRAKPKPPIPQDEQFTNLGMRIKYPHEKLFWCSGFAYSNFYPNGPRPPHIPEPAWEWYKPSQDEIRTLDRANLEHVAKGGLVIRPLTKRESAR